MIELQAPKNFSKYDEYPAVFLAGSIEMGKASNWQRRLCDSLSELDVLVLNPRRADWNSSWKQEINNPRFFEQVNWELEAMDRADLIAMYLEPGTLSPISLLELGLHADHDKLVVCCPDGFWRKGNVDIVCQRYNIPVVSSVDELTDTVITHLDELCIDC